MGKLLTLQIAGVIFFIGSTHVSAQTNQSASHNISIVIPEVALLDLESSSTSSFTTGPSVPSEAGDALDFTEAVNDQLWVYSSVIGSSEPERRVSAFIEGTIPEGVVVSVVASPYSGEGKGKTGIPSGKVILSNTPQDIITNIGSCYTGDGIHNGHQLTYTVELDKTAGSYAKLNFDESTTVSVTYTLSDNN